jgi:hypothetical protein
MRSVSTPTHKCAFPEDVNPHIHLVQHKLYAITVNMHKKQAGTAATGKLGDIQPTSRRQLLLQMGVAPALLSVVIRPGMMETRQQQPHLQQC